MITAGWRKAQRVFLALLVVAAGDLHGETDVPIDEPVAILQPMADLHDPVAQFKLGLRYSKGRDVPPDSALAMKWYRQSAEQNFPAAQFNLAVAVNNGSKTPEAQKEAARWFHAAASNGMFEAQKVMVELYTRGLGVEKSPANALTWDMIARRTLELRYGLLAGLPPHPSAKRTDGATEMKDKDGSKYWVHADGSRETMDREGLRHVEHRDGCKTVIQPDGAWFTTFPDGRTQEATAEGRMTYRNVDTFLIMEPNGSRIEEVPGTRENGEKVRIRDAFGPDGQRITRRVSGAIETLEDRADGTRFLETKVRRSDRVWVVLVQEVSTNGFISDGKVREEKTRQGPQGDETWIIRRVIHTKNDEDVGIKEVYSAKGLVSRERETEPGQVVIMPTPPPASATDTPASNPPPSPPKATPGPAVLPTTAAPPTLVRPPVRFTDEPILSRSSDGEDPTAFAPPIDLKPMLASLEKLEAETLNFSGATEADYKRAQDSAKTYLIPLGITPQKPTTSSAWMRGKVLTSITLPTLKLNPIADDRSSVIPFGVHGVEAIKLTQWKHMETDHFIVHYVGDAEAKLVMQFIEGAYTVFTQLLNIDLERGVKKSHVFIFSESGWRDYREKQKLAPEIAGFAFGTELLLGADAGREDRAQSVMTLCHEVTHALGARFYAGRWLPIWLNEGLAEYIALRTMNIKGVKEAANFAGRPDPKMDVAKLFRRERYGARTAPDRLRAFYANSQKAVRTLFEKLPADGFSKFLNLIAAGNEPGIALSATYGPQCESIKAFEEIVNRP